MPCCFIASKALEQKKICSCFLRFKQKDLGELWQSVRDNSEAWPLWDQCICIVI